MDTPRLPWEVIERVIDISCGRPNTLCSLALTCRQLRPRSHVVMFGRIQLESSDHVFDFVAFLQANSQLKTLVRTIVVTPAAFGPSLLYILPNLSSIECVDESQLEEPEDEHEQDEIFNIPDRAHPPTSVRVHRSLAIHHISLACFTRLGAHIRTLHLNSVSFPTTLSLAQMLLSFAHITRLVCKKVEVKTASNGASLEVVARRLSEQMRLKEFIIDSFCLTHNAEGRSACPGLLFDPRFAPSTVEHLVIEVSRLDLFPYRWQSDWCRLEHLVLQFSGEAGVHRVAEFMERFPNTPGLCEVLIEWRRWSQRIAQDILSCNDHESRSIHQAYKKLEQALLRFPRTRLKFVVDDLVDTKTLSIWTYKLEKHLPALLAHGGAIECKASDHPVPGPSPHQHQDGVQVLVISPDSKWVATGSQDSTIILWHTTNGATVRRWVPHGYNAVVTSLVFSPDSQYLLSAGDDGTVAIWDISQGTQRKVAMLEGQVAAVLTCAWSPDGGAIATGSEDGTMRLWDAHTFLQRAVFQLKGAVVCLAFSPNGAWLAYASDRGECCFLNLTPTRNALHEPRFLWNSPPDQSLWLAPVRDRIMAFDPSDGSTRIAIAPCGSPVGLSVVDVETGRVLVQMEGQRGKNMVMHDFSFSPDGKLVLGVSSIFDGGVSIWQASTGIRLFRLQQYIDDFRKAGFSPCGRYIAAAAMDLKVRLWKTNDGPFLWRSSDESRTSSFKDTDTVHVAFSSDGRTLCSARTMDGTVVIRRMHDIIPPGEDSGPHA